MQRTETYYRAIVNLLSFFNKNTQNIHTRDLLFYVQTFRIKTDYNNYTDQIIKTDILKILIPEKNDFYRVKLNCQQVKEANHTEKFKTKTNKKSLRKYKKESAVSFLLR